MSREFVVIKAFIDLEDNRHVYKGGHFYPRKGTELDEARADALASNNNVRNEPLIVEVVVREEKDHVEDEQEMEFPKHTGGGHYELSNGEKVQGKEKAIEAEKALKE